MNILAIETSSSHLSIALGVGERIAVRAEVLANGGSERILPWLGELLAECGLTRSDLDAIAFGAGPGAFTGLRLACGVTQGLAYGLDLPVLGISTLEACALNAGQARVVVCIDARMGEVYSGAYAVADGVVSCLQAPAVTPPTQIDMLAESGFHGVGDGFAAYGEVLRQRLPLLAGIDAAVYPNATAVLRLAQPRFARGEGLPAAQAAPLYVRDKVALTTAERLARGGSK